METSKTSFADRAIKNRRHEESLLTSSVYRDFRKFVRSALVTLFALLLLGTFLMPFAFMLTTAFKNHEQMSLEGAPLWPALPVTYNYQGQDYPMYERPAELGGGQWALVKMGLKESYFVDPNHPEAGLIKWEGRWRTLTPLFRFQPAWDNIQQVWDKINFLRLLFNTLAIATLGTIGTLLSCTAVAYGFSRFRMPGKSILFLLLITTIFLPQSITLVPTYAIFTKIGWVGTWLPLIVPHFFGNAYNVFLLRQYFMTIPRELDEAAMIDGAGPLRTLVSIILPQSWGIVIAVAIFHFVWAWNDFFAPYIYLATKPDLQPISVGMQVFNSIYAGQPQLIQMTSLLGLLIPVALFFMGRTVMMREVVMSGVTK